jgi:hypothetical protein
MNQQLSQDRAQAVIAYLIQDCIPFLASVTSTARDGRLTCSPPRQRPASRAPALNFT